MKKSGIVLLLFLSACARPTVAPPVVSVPSEPPEIARLADADALVRAGCLDCLVQAFHEYSALRAFEQTREAADVRRGRTAALIALRQLELGMVEEDYWSQADPSWLLEVARTVTLGPVPRSPIPDAAALRRLLVSEPEPIGVARDRAANHELAAYLWLTIACSSLGTSVSQDDRLAPAEVLADTPLFLYREASGCPPTDKTALEALLNGDERFKEIHFFLGNAALGSRARAGAPSGEPDLDLADNHYRLAYEWRSSWPAVTLMIAHLAMTAEDFPRALEFYDRTLTMLNRYWDAMLGRVRALTYMARHEEAIAATEPLLKGGRTVGEARYWRALNETQLERNEEAWEDIELAATMLVNVDVPKLAGIIAIRRGQLDVARRRLEEAQSRQASWRVAPPDCDIGFYLQAVLSEQRLWDGAVKEAMGAAECFDAQTARLSQEIEKLQASDIAADRKERQIARRGQLMRLGVRRNANARDNAAAANYNLQRRDEARRLAGTLVDDEVFGERARIIMESEK
jgi:tetratricopeptide (TPR) repeat protein